ncbi:unnamed protein product [Auanema sp. JU1783]|nr:unnamed protein product [Auanema sp. JU1783]
MGLISVRDESTQCIRYRFLNSQICLWIGCCQVVVCLWGVAQHGHSYTHHNKILKCDFVSGTLPLEAADAVIFDVGLLHSLWGIRGCVAEYLDGGLGRLLWCISHCLSLLFSLPFAFASRPRPYCLWPLLVQQSVYGIGLLILFLAALPRILPLIIEPMSAPLIAIVVYIAGTTGNFFLLYVSWHWYWHVDSMWNTAIRVRFGQIVRNANNRSRRDKPIVAKEQPSFPLPTVESEVQVVSTSPPVSIEASTSRESELSYVTPEKTPPVIIATPLYSNSIENKYLRAQDVARLSRVRRVLPPTPDEDPAMISKPIFYLSNSQL